MYPALILLFSLLSCSTLREPAEEEAGCALCHDSIIHAEYGPHAFHNRSAGCGDCHAGYNVGAVDSVNPATHKNGTVDVAFSAAAGSPAAFDTLARTCNFIACHGNLGGVDYPVSWPEDTALACGACHAIPPATGGHRVHAAAGDTLACLTCHPPSSDSTHKNSRVDVRLSGLAGPVAAYDSITKVCNNIYCHGSFAGGLNASAAWTSDTPFVCGRCHVTSGLVTGSHAIHATYNLSCDSCHPPVPDSNYLSHIKSHFHLAGSSFIFQSGECSEISCHRGFREPEIDSLGSGHGNVVWTDSAAAWGSRLRCQYCHNTKSTSQPHAALMCYLCHGAVTRDDSTIADPAAHFPDLFP